MTDPAPEVLDPAIQLGHTESLAVGVKRVAMDQLEIAAEGFFEPASFFGEAVHQSRKSIKRVRALLRLIRSGVPKKIFEFENHSLRDTGRLLSEVRSTSGVLDAAESVVELYGDLLADGTFDELIVGLERRRDLAELAALEDPNLVGRVVRSLERAYHRYGSWPTDSEAREVYGGGVDDSYSAIEPGLTATFAKGRRGMVTAYTTPTDVHFHDWRKRVKDLRHQMEFLTPLWPEVVVGLAVTLDRLGEVLGEDHDLAELNSLLSTRPDLCPDPRERSLFRALSEQRRRELHVAAEVLGRRIYADRPEALAGRFGEYWDSRQLAIAAPLETVVVY